MIVLDASAVLEVLLRTPNAEAVSRAPVRIASRRCTRRICSMSKSLRSSAATPRAGEIDQERGRAALADLSDFPLRRYPHDVLLPRIWDLRHNLTAYDAAYVALAEALDAPLLTRDQRLAAAAGHHARVELV